MARSLTIIFAVSAGLGTGAVVGTGLLLSPLFRDHDAATTAPVKNARDQTAFKQEFTALAPVEADVQSVGADGTLNVMAHVWVAQYARASVCPQQMTPVHCSYQADLLDGAGHPLANAKAGDKVWLGNLRATGVVGAKAAFSDVTLPVARPRQDRLAGPIKAHVTRLVDGDTVAVVAEPWPGYYVMTDIRMGGIDTPEKGSRAKCTAEADRAQLASAATARLLENKDIFLRDVQFEKYGGRVLGTIITTQGVDAAQSLTAQNLAHAYDGGKKEGWCPRG